MASKQTNKQKHSKNNDKKTVSILSKEAFFFFFNQGSIIYSTGQQKYSSPMNSGLKLTQIA